MIFCNVFKCLIFLVRGYVVFVKMCNDNFFLFYLNVFVIKDKVKRSLNLFEFFIFIKFLIIFMLDENVNINMLMVWLCYGYDN